MLSKIFWMIFTPLTFIGICLTVGMCLRQRRYGLWILGTGICLFLTIGFLPVGHNILVWLEGRYPVPTLPNKIDGIIVLGGFIDLSQSVAHGEPQLNVHANRLSAFIALSRNYPQAKMVFSGGNGSVFDSSSSEAEQVHIVLKKLGFHDAKVVYEDKSRNTYENMVNSYQLVHPQAGENWVMISSAYHLPRAAGVFHSHDWPVIPYPAGYLTNGTYRWLPSPDVLGGFYKFQVALREIVGIIAYIFTERIEREHFAEDKACLHTGPCAVISRHTVIPSQGGDI